MRRFLTACLTAFLSLYLTSAQAQAPTWTWGAPLTGEDTLFYRGTLRSIVADGAGGAYVAGSFTNPMTCGTTTLTSNGGCDAFVGHLDAANQWQWLRQIGGDQFDDATSLAVSPSGDLIVGGVFSGSTSGNVAIGAFSVVGRPYQRNFFLASISATGQWQWATGGSGQGRAAASSVGVDAAGQVFVCGRYDGNQGTTFTITNTPPITIPPGPIGYFLSQFSPSGQHVHTAFAAGSTYDNYTNGPNLTVAPTGEVLLAGRYYDNLTLGTILLPPPATATRRDGFLARYVPTTRQWSWAQTLHGTGSTAVPGNQARQVQADAQGHLYLSGYFDGSITLSQALNPVTLTSTPGTTKTFIARLDAATGTVEWATTSELGGFIQLTGNRLFVLGTFSGILTLGTTTLTASNTDGLVARLDPDTGNWLWAVAGASVGRASVNALASLNGTDMLIGGFHSAGPISFGNLTIPLAAPYQSGLYLARLQDNALGLPDAKPASAFTLTPNPASFSVHLTGTGPVEIVDALGRQVRTAAGPADLTVEVQSLPPGLYSVWRNGQTRRLVVE